MTSIAARAANYYQHNHRHHSHNTNSSSHTNSRTRMRKSTNQSKKSSTTTATITSSHPFNQQGAAANDISNTITSINSTTVDPCAASMAVLQTTTTTTTSTSGPANIDETTHTDVSDPHWDGYTVSRKNILK